MGNYILKNQKIPKKLWLNIAQNFRKGRTLPIDTKDFPIDANRLIEFHGLLGFMNALTDRGFRLGNDFILVESEVSTERNQEQKSSTD